MSLREIKSWVRCQWCGAEVANLRGGRPRLFCHPPAKCQQRFHARTTKTMPARVGRIAVMLRPWAREVLGLGPDANPIEPVKVRRSRNKLILPKDPPPEELVIPDDDFPCDHQPCRCGRDYLTLALTPPMRTADGRIMIDWGEEFAA